LDAGYLVFSVDYRLAPPGTISGQPNHSDPLSSRPPQQSNDIKQQVLAARNDTSCDGIVFVIGGSSGGSHAVWAALDPAPTVPEWDFAQLANAAVGLSGAYDYSDWRPDPNIDAFIQIIENYTNNITDPNTLKSLSPVSLVTSSRSRPS
jgi:acetyl esterase/lipase